MALSKVDERTDCAAGNIPEEVLASQEPVILRGFGKSWPIVQSAEKSLEQAARYLKQFNQDKPVTVCRGTGDNAARIFYSDDYKSFNFTATREPFQDLVDALLKESGDENSPALYMPSTDIQQYFHGFDRENNAGLDGYNPIRYLWMGNTTRIAAHYDFPINLACSVVGRRRFTLFPPEQISNLYPGPLQFAPGGQEISLVDFHKPDLDKFPKFKFALEHALVAELDQGDALLLPGMWWHHVEGLDGFNVLYTHWWRDSAAHLGRPGNALLSAVLHLRSLPIHQRRAWKAVFDHYIFNDELESAHIPDDAKGILDSPLDEAAARRLRQELQEQLKR